MTAQEIILLLESQGIVLSLHENQIKVQATAKVSDEHKALIKSNKDVLLTHFSKRDSTETSEHPQREMFKEYKLPNGNVLSISKEEFAEIVELFRLLQKQSERLGPR